VNDIGFRLPKAMQREMGDYAGLDYFVTDWGCPALWQAITIYATVF
jgi:hypothetical protein